MSKRKGGLVGSVLWGEVPNEEQNGAEKSHNIGLVATKTPIVKGVAERVKEINPNKCKLWCFADRPEDEADHADDIAQSFIESEQIHPVIVRELSPSDSDYPALEYEVIAGSVRWRAAKKAGTHLKAFVRALSDKEALNLMLIENVQRKNISEYARALQIKRVWDSGLFASKVELAFAHKMDQSKVSRYLKVAEHKDELLTVFSDEIKTIGLRQLYQTAIGDEKEEGVKHPKPATRKEISEFTCSFGKNGITTIKIPMRLSEDKIQRIKEIMHENN